MTPPQSPDSSRVGRLQSKLGVVAIGRNEGERLRRCLESVTRLTKRVVYVDSGSTDGSAAMANAMDVEVMALDMLIPFTAARARNEGFRHLRELVPDLSYVQFIDGDCEVADRWLESAAMFLSENESVAAVCGRLREKYPAQTVYNMLCDIEWDTPVGEVKACGGISMMRVEAFESVQGYRDDLIAGEEPELCVRLRARGWRILRLDQEMALHDAAMTKFSQWWKRAMRAGHAFAQGADLHGALPERHFVRESLSAWFWGLGIPFAVLGLALYSGTWAFMLLLIYPLQVIRLALSGERSVRENWWRAVFLVLGKFPELLGQVTFLCHRYLGNRSRLIEYK